MAEVVEAEVVHAAQALMRAYRELLGLVSDVLDSIAAEDDTGAVAHLSCPLVAALRRHTHHQEEAK